MKRAAMLAIIDKAVKATIEIEDSKLVFDTDKISEKILSEVEKIMLPPLIKIEGNDEELFFKWDEEI